MLKANVLDVVFEESPGGVWQTTSDVATEWVVEDAEAAARDLSAASGLSRTARKLAETEASAAAQAAIIELRSTCPLRRSGESLQFIHKSFWEYFCARLILLAAGSGAPRDTRVARAVSALSIPGRRIQTEPEVLYFLADHWHHEFADDSDVGRARECLFAVVAGSASGVGVEHGAAANAATILNWMGEPMLRQPWDGVVLEGADLTRAVLCGTSLKVARLSGCRVEKALLSHVTLEGADLTSVQLGENAPIPVWAGSGLRCLVAHPALPDVLAVAVNREVQLWSLSSRVQVGKSLPHGATVHSLAALCAGKGVSLLVSGDSAGVVRVWDVTDGCGDAGAVARGPLALWSHPSNGKVHSVALGPASGNSSPCLVAGGFSDGSVRVWHVDTGDVVLALGPREHHVCSTAFGVTAAGVSLLAVGDFSGRVTVWVVGGSWDVRMDDRHHRGGAKTLVFGLRPSGNLVLACGTTTGQVCLWNAGVWVRVCQCMRGP